MTSTIAPSDRVSSRIIPWLPSLAYMALIWVLSSFSTQSVPGLRVPFVDKGVHVAEFAVLGIFLMYGLHSSWPHRPLWLRACVAALVSTLWGVLDEIHQYYVPGRSAEVVDGVADLLGSVVGVACFVLLLRVHRSKSKRSESSNT